MPFFIVILFIPISASAFLDWVGEEAKKAVEVAAYADAVTELMGEVSPNEQLKEGAKDLNLRAEKLRSEASTYRYLSSATQSVLKGPDWSSERLETNIRSTTDYARKLKRLVGRIAALGMNGATALNTTETNIALNEVQKNQQVLILQNEESKVRDFEKEHEEAKTWTEFSEKQRALRSESGKHGKFR